MIYMLRDDFTGGIPISAGAMGETGWSILSTADAGHVTAPIPGESGHPGIWRISCAPVANSILSCCRTMDGVIVNPYIAADIQEAFFLVRTLSSNNQRLLVGFADDPIGATATVLNGGTRGAYAFFDPGVSASWIFRTRNASVNTDTDLGVPVAGSTWYGITFSRTPAGGWVCRVNAGIATHSTNLPSGSVSPALTVQSLTASARTLHVDFAYILPGGIRV